MKETLCRKQNVCSRNAEIQTLYNADVSNNSILQLSGPQTFDTRMQQCSNARLLATCELGEVYQRKYSFDDWIDSL